MARTLLRLLPVLLATLLLAAAPVAAEPRLSVDAASATKEGAGQNVAAPPKAADHASKRRHYSASLEEFVGIDDDAEQYLKRQAVLPRFAADTPFAADPPTSFCRATLHIHPARAAFPTGPPHA